MTDRPPFPSLYGLMKVVLPVKYSTTGPHLTFDLDHQTASSVANYILRIWCMLMLQHLVHADASC